MEATLRAERKARKEAKRLRKAALYQKALLKPAKKRKYASCTGCKQNPKSDKCVHQMCKRCCITKTLEVIVDCEQHHVMAKSRHDRKNAEKMASETKNSGPISASG